MPSKSVIPYDRLLPEIPDRRPWERPSSYLVKDASVPDGWRIEGSGRRPSNLLLIEKLRLKVDAWRDAGYPGSSEVTQRLFSYWFEEEHEVAEFGGAFRYHFCQREAIETLIYIVEVFEKRDTKPLIETFGRIVQQNLLSKSVEFQTTADGQRQIRRYVPEKDEVGIQDLPPKDLRRYAFKMATGSGKTWVMAMAIVWSYFHRQKIEGSGMAGNFLIVAPNVIVYQRLARDFAGNRIFNTLPLVPPEWRMSLKPILRGESTEPDANGNLFLSNIQQLYERGGQWTPVNAVQAILGPKPAKDLSGGRSMLDRVKDLKNLAVMNDEAHHVHDEGLTWNQSLQGIHEALPKGLALWLDFSATPKDQRGMFYPWTLCEYPLAQAVEDRIVKAPIIVHRESDSNAPAEPENVTQDNVCKEYHYWIDAAVKRWREHQKTYKTLKTKPVLFIMAEKSAFADAIGEYLQTNFDFKQAEVLVIHTDTKGEISPRELEAAREAARDIDRQDSRIKAIVSVMMLREGWDVRNVTVVLGLRPFTAKAQILPEQTIGRGLRLMFGIGPDTQTLEVLGTKRLLDFLRESLEAEGVGVGVANGDPQQAVTVYPVEERKAYDIAIPITKPQLFHSESKLSDLDPLVWSALWDCNPEDLAEVYRLKLRMEFGTTNSMVHQVEIADDAPPIAQALLSTIAARIVRQAKLTGPQAFATLFPVVQSYISARCFGRTVDVETIGIRSNLRRPDIQSGIVNHLARQVAKLTVESKAIEFENAGFTLFDTKPFHWRRNLMPKPLECVRTVFNYVATYNGYERRFAEFLDKAPDVLRFASLGTTEQGESGTRFRVDYLKSSGAIGFYHPDWVVVQSTSSGETHWIIETKGRPWEGTLLKDSAMTLWCDRMTERTKTLWRFKRIDQRPFDLLNPKTLAEAVGDVTAQSSLL